MLPCFQCLTSACCEVIPAQWIAAETWAFNAIYWGAFCVCPLFSTDSQTQDWVTVIVLFYSQHCCPRDLKHLTLFMDQSFWACLFFLLWGKTSSWHQGEQLSPPKSLTSPQTAAESWGQCLGLILMLRIKKNLYSSACLPSWISQIELILLLQFTAFQVFSCPRYYSYSDICPLL